MRPSRDQWAMILAMETARRSTCLRRQVGCVLLNRRGHVLATGYNGVAAGMPHCNDVDLEGFTTNPHPWACQAAHAASGSQLEGCEAIHAEQNALLQCRDVYDIEECFVTASPCITCTKLLLNTSCQRIIFIEAYPHPAAADLWRRAGREWVQLRVGESGDN